jgi:dienelactone hydrolase
MAIRQFSCRNTFIDILFDSRALLGIIVFVHNKQGTGGTPMSARLTSHIEIAPNPALLDETVHIRLSELDPGTSVILTAEMTDDSGERWKSHAEYMTDSGGMVDLNSTPPVSGTYSDMDPMGLFWSMEPSSDKNRNALFLKNTLDPVSMVFTVTVKEQQVCSATLERHFILMGTDRITVKERGLRGVLFRPPGSGPFAGIITLSGSGGGINEMQAALLASHGYAVLTLAYFHYDDLPEDLANIPLEYFETALNWLGGLDFVDGDRLVVTGRSRGGELVLLLGSVFPQIKAVIAYVPSGLVWGGFTRDDRDIPAWTFRGNAFPHVKDHVSEEKKKEIFAGEPYAVTPYFHACLEESGDLEDKTIAVEKINGSVLLISGRDDQMWPSSMLSDRIMTRFESQPPPAEACSLRPLNTAAFRRG